MSTSLVTLDDQSTAIVKLVVDSLTSDHSKRAYEKALIDFMAWYTGQGKPGLNKATVQAYREVLRSQGLSSSTINVRMSAIRKLASEAADNGLLDQQLANGIANVKGVSSKGVRSGNWLTKQQAQQLLNLPDIETLKGLRDRAILAVLLGAGLRRSEVSSLALAHIQQREGRWAIVDLVGKGNRVRTIPIAQWVKVCLDAWTSAALVTDGLVFRSMNRHGQITGDSMSDQAVGDLVTEYGQAMGIENLAAHDLRRSFAKLARKAGCPLEQVQLNLGHASIATTERYLGSDLDFTDSPSDFIKLRVKSDL